MDFAILIIGMGWLVLLSLTYVEVRRLRKALARLSDELSEISKLASLLEDGVHLLNVLRKDLEELARRVSSVRLEVEASHMGSDEKPVNVDKSEVEEVSGEPGERALAPSRPPVIMPRTPLGWRALEGGGDWQPRIVASPGIPPEVIERMIEEVVKKEEEKAKGEGDAGKDDMELDY